MRSKKTIEKALADMEIRKKSYLLDMVNYKEPNSVQYDTELIRKLEVTDATIHVLNWVLFSKKIKSKK